MIRDLAILLLVSVFLSSCSKHEKMEQPAFYIYPVQQKYTYADYVKDYYKKLINKDLIGKLQITGDSTKTEYFITYLGNLEIDNREYFVLTQSFGTKDENEEIGHNEIIFLNSNYENVKTYSSPIENVLPKFIKSNKLIFQDENFCEWIDFEDEIPDHICLRNGSCYG